MEIPFSERFRVLKRFSNSKRKFGQVFLVEEKATSDKFVIKFLDKVKAKESALVQLRSEATFSFDSNSLQSSLEISESETEVFLVKEFIEGKPLSEFTDGKKKKEKLWILKEVFRQLESAFLELETKQIVHGDIKPGNIIINETSNGITASLIDFGLSFRRNEAMDRKLLFPLGYAAPELLLNKLEIVDFTTDCYALGVTIWKVFEEKLPLIHPNPSITTNLQLNHPLPILSKSLREVNDVIQKCTIKHSFNIPPNRMKRSEQIVELKKAQLERYASYNLFLEDFLKIKLKSCLF